MPRKNNDPKKLHQLRLGQQREVQKSQGFFDGRFVQRSEPSGTSYVRHKKHRNRSIDDL
jgi:hypothetical protein